MTKAISIAWSRISRAPYQTLAAVSIMTMTLFLASVFFLLAAGSQAVLKYFETRPQVNAFFNKDYVPQTEEIAAIKSRLESTGLVADFRYVSKDEALKIYKDLNKSDPLLTEAVTAQMLPASVEISANSPDDLKVLAEDIKKEKGVEDVRFAEDIVSSLTQWTNSVRIIGASFVGAHILITFSIILLIIGIKVANRKDEIQILQLVGATTAYISGPFVWEGIIYGLFGAVIAWSLSYVLLLSSMGFLNSFLSGIPVLPVSVLFMLQLLAGELLVGALVGSLGGLIATRRYLKP
jgi:cell division transport system permease protein